mmetsp:Transcript_67816/g.134521  ORF Transcript_67816/g.134521 Transcript_67816/m.134521 type:complete len:90 (-) Transcript_67816:29-298(-)
MPWVNRQNYLLFAHSDLKSEAGFHPLPVSVKATHGSGESYSEFGVPRSRRDVKAQLIYFRSIARGDIAQNFRAIAQEGSRLSAYAEQDN